MIAYLECEVVGEFPNRDYIALRFRNSQGDQIGGFFNKFFAKRDFPLKGTTSLEVTTVESYPNGTVLVQMPQKTIIYGGNHSGNQLVDSFNLTYPEGTHKIV